MSLQRHATVVLLFCAMASLFCGCAGYRLGPTNGMRSGDKSVQVNPFINKVLEQPRLSEYVTLSIRRQVQQDGTFALDTHQDGDVIVEGILTGYDRSYLSFQPQDIITPRDYEITLKALVTARERRSGKILLHRAVVGRTTIRIGNDLASAERQAAPLLAEDLGRKVTDLLVDGEW
jgi:hypothetical protein